MDLQQDFVEEEMSVRRDAKRRV